MAVCFTSFERDGFWCRDDGILVWFAVLADALDGLASAASEPWAQQQWARSLAALWHELDDFSFDEVSLNLSDYVETDERRVALVLLGRTWRARVASGGRRHFGDAARRAAAPLWRRDPAGARGRVVRSADAFLWLLERPRPALPANLIELWRDEPAPYG